MVPVAIHGSQSVRAWKRLVFPKVTIQYGEPVTFPVVAEPSREQAHDASVKIFDEVRSMYSALDERGRGSVIKSLRESAAAAAVPPSESVHS